MNAGLARLLAASKLYDRGLCTAIDVGAHRGEFTRYLIESGLFGNVLSFEPNPENFVLLASDVASSATCRFQPVNLALGATSGAQQFHCDDDTATGSLLHYEPRQHSPHPVGQRTVEVTTLDEYLATNPPATRVQLMKIDTQGTDLDVIRGSQQTLREHRPLIQTELIYIPLYQGQCSPDDLAGAMAELDYRMYSLNNLHVTPEGRLAFCDALFIPAEHDVPITQRFSCIDDEVSFRNQLETLHRI